MSINVNPKDWFDTRMISYTPKHFSRINLQNTPISSVLPWITENLTGRYSFVTEVNGSANRVSVTHIGFEDPKDATMFSLFFKN